MKWQGGKQSGNFEDRRGMSGGGKLALGGIGDHRLGYWFSDGWRSHAVVATGAKYGWANGAVWATARTKS
ncbi:hypothetical protein [Sphingobacterium sp. E70]|uniref:hypothetical protein n=1 Tax=Sphingobacterium sp. E70 TaxID=2853439 RepID=UPI002795FF74|nr:hypothetical protein [Sphingobacterium sp. E70]